ncbi:MAG: DM13 domain-containing protein, partial [Nitrosopumilaceae archaeon]
MNKNILIAVAVAVVLIPAGVYALSPLFRNTTIDEPLPMAKDTATEMMKKDDSMTKEKTETMMEKKAMVSLTGNFVGVGDGIHNAEGVTKIVSLEDGSYILRLENFKSTNGPDLYVYLSTDTSASDYVSLGRLKANNGNQNYEIPEGTDLSKYDTILIWCK